MTAISDAISRLSKAWVQLFSRKKPADKEDAFLSYAHAELELFRQWRPVGTEIVYAGRKLIVSGHGEFMPFGWDGFYFQPSVRARYFDDHRVLREVTFSNEEVLAMMGREKA